MNKELIKVPPKFFGKELNKSDTLTKLESNLRKTASKFNQYGFVDNTEEIFLAENRGKKVTIELKNGKEITGILDSLDKYRIQIYTDDSVYFFYKHAVVSYCAEE